MYTFSDGQHDVFTVTNVPDEIRVPASPDPNPHLNKAFRELLRPQYATRVCPELGYVLRKPPAKDPLLARLYVDNTLLRPIRYQDGWSLHMQLRNSWVQLERGLLHVSNLLLSLANTPEAVSIRPYENWHEPSECGYTNVHRSEHGASIAIQKSREAFMFLVGRTSLAVAVWVSDSMPRNTTPSWMVFLSNQGVPASWVDALNASVITDFRHGLRVGTFIDPAVCAWIKHVPVYLRAKIPVFVKWRAADMQSAPRELQCLRPRDNDYNLAYRTPPRRAAPHVFKLYYHGEGRPHPFNAALEQRLAPPPSGPFQRPGESRIHFLNRMAAHQTRMLSRELPGQRSRREARELYAQTGQLPKPYTRVYLWIVRRRDSSISTGPEGEYNNPPEQEVQIRAPVARGTVAVVWDMTRPQNRHYNSTFDEWDIWLDENVAEGESRSLSATVPAPHFEDVATVFTAEMELLYQTTVHDDGAGIHFPPAYLRDRYFLERYGLYPSTIAASDGDYTKYPDGSFCGLFGLTKEHHNVLPEAVRRVYRGWAAAMTTPNSTLSAAQCCWDMHKYSLYFLFSNARNGHLLRKIVVEKCRPKGASEQILYLVRYADDSAELDWTLAVPIEGILHLLRCLERTTTSPAALHELVSIGGTCHSISGIQEHISPVPPREEAGPFDDNNSRKYVHRSDRHRHTSMDYHQYTCGVLDLLGSGPHMRAALLCGGIIWRIAMEYAGQNSGMLDLLRLYVELGPSDEGSGHVQVLQDEAGRSFVDDGLTDIEKDILCGVNKVYSE